MPSLAAAEERWRLTIDNAPVGIALTSLEGQFMRVNDALCAMLGYPAETLYELTFQRITHPDDLGPDLELLRQLMDGSIPSYQLRKRYLHRDGHAIWIDLSVGLVRNDRGRPLHYVTHVIDRTAEVATAARIEQMNADLQSQAEALARSNADLEAFAMLVSHDLQAPLATIRGYVELLREEYAEQPDSQAADWFDRVRDSTERMSELVTSLLAFSRSGPSPELTEVSVAEVVALVTADLSQQLGAAQGVVEVAPGPSTVLADGPRLRQVLQNLLQNSLKHHHPDRRPHVVVAVGTREHDWLVTVDDNASGVPEDQREQVFTMFHRSPGPDGGHGIGLAACRRIVERHGGRIWLEANPAGPGSRVAFTLPRGPGAA